MESIHPTGSLYLLWLELKMNLVKKSQNNEITNSGLMCVDIKENTACVLKCPKLGKLSLHCLVV